MSYVIKYRGEDIKVQVRIYDDIAEDYVPIVLLAKEEIYVINLTTNRILQKFNIDGTGGFRQLLVEDEYTYYGWIYDTETEDAKLGKYIIKTIFGVNDITLPDGVDEDSDVEEGFNLRS